MSEVDVEKIVNQAAKTAQTQAQILYEAEHDCWIYRMVTFFLGLITLFCVGSALYLASWGLEVPQFLTAVGSAAGGGLVAMLTNPPK